MSALTTERIAEIRERLTERADDIEATQAPGVRGFFAVADVRDLLSYIDAVTAERDADRKALGIINDYFATVQRERDEALKELEGRELELGNLRALTTPRGRQNLIEQRDQAIRERDAARVDAARLDWWGKHIHQGPSVGLFTDGHLGLARGHVVDTRWVVKGVGYPSLRAAIDAAMHSSPSATTPEAPRVA